MIALEKTVETMALGKRLENRSSADAANLLIEEVADLRARLRRLEELLERAGSGQSEKADVPSLPSTTRLAVGDSLDAGRFLSPFSGFYPVESDAATGLFRWTGPTNEFTFHLDLDRKPAAHFELRLLGALKAEQCEGLMLVADGGQVPLRIDRTPEGYSAHFQLAPAKQAFTILMFIVPRIFRPADIHDSDDLRPLGVRFRDLKLLG